MEFFIDYDRSMLYDERDDALIRELCHSTFRDKTEYPIVEMDVIESEDGLLYLCVETIERSGKKSVVPIHQILLGLDRDVKVIHQNGDTLDNRRRNLIIATSTITEKVVREARLGFKSGLKKDPDQGWYGWYEPNGERKIVSSPKGKSRKLAAIALRAKLLAYEPVRRKYDGRGWVIPQVPQLSNWTYKSKKEVLK